MAAFVDLCWTLLFASAYSPDLPDPVQHLRAAAWTVHGVYQDSHMSLCGAHDWHVSMLLLHETV